MELYKKTLQCRREAYSTLLKVASELTLFTSITDWLDFMKERNTRSDNGSWVSWVEDGMCVELHVATMCLMCSKGGGNAAKARYLLDYTQHDVLVDALISVLWQ